MQKLLRSRKGFTLIELIVVIVIIAILIAALTPAILGVIRRANRAADEADLRTVMTAGSVLGTLQTPPGIPPATATFSDELRAEMTGGSNVHTGTYFLWYDGAVVVGGRIVAGGRLNQVGDPVEIGDTDGAADRSFIQ